MKKRPAGHVIAELGVLAVQKFCLENDLIFQGVPSEDYGIDCYLEIAIGSDVQNFIVGVQVKSGASFFRGEDGNHFHTYINEDDVKYWLASNIPVFYACYHPERKELYLKHVQAYVGSLSKPLAAINRIDFDKIADQAGPGLARYLRDLVSMTPSTVDRLKIASCEAPLFFTPDSRFELAPTAPNRGNSQQLLDLWSALDLNNVSIPPGTEILPQRESRIVGFSEDGSWVLLLSVKHVGQKCDHLTFDFVDRLQWQKMSLPFYTEADHDRGAGLPPEELRKRINDAQRYIDDLKIMPSIEIYRKYAYNSPAVLMALEFNELRFSMQVEQESGRCALMLRADKFKPTREAAVVIERLKPGFMIPWPPGEIPVPDEYPKGVESICEIATNPQRNLLAIGMLTNSEHSCWGNNDVTHLFLSTQEIRDLCIRALRA